MRRVAWILALFFAFTSLGTLAAAAQVGYGPGYGGRGYRIQQHERRERRAYYRHEMRERRAYRRHEIRERRRFLRHERRERIAYRNYYGRR